MSTIKYSLPSGVFGDVAEESDYPDEFAEDSAELDPFEEDERELEIPDADELESMGEA